ncbi:MAG: hypothetical protein ACKOOF_06910 [Planctomycetaceae bacterium]
MKRYLLPCGCSERIVVTAGQAGDDVQCPVCRALVPVPRLGGLAALEQASEPPAPLRRWTAGHGWGVAGLLVAAAAVAAAVGLRSWSLGTPPAGDAEIRAAVAASDIVTVHRAGRDLARSGVQRPPSPEEARRERIFRSGSLKEHRLVRLAAG